MIEELITMVAEKLGIDQGMAEKGVGTLLSLLKDQAGDAPALGELFGAIGGAEALADQFPQGGTDSGGGLMGGLMGKAADMLGGGAGDAMDALAAFQSTGLSMDQAKDMMPVVKGFMTENVGEDTLRQLMESVPALQGLLR